MDPSLSQRALSSLLAMPAADLGEHKAYEPVHDERATAPAQAQLNDMNADLHCLATQTVKKGFLAVIV